MKESEPKMSAADIAYRGLAATVGGPVDLVSLAMRPFGYDVAEPFMGSEWIGSRLEDTGLISSARNPLAEFAAALLSPDPMSKGKAAVSVPAVAGILAGKASRMWNKAAAQTARDMEKAGVPARQIWEQTGSWRGPDGKWRQEIPDDQARMDLTPAQRRATSPEDSVDVPLSDLIAREVSGLSESTPVITKALQRRGLKGDRLADVMDTAEELAGAGAKIRPDGTVTVYHRTTKEAAERIVKEGRMIGKEDSLFFGTSPTGQIEGYGDAVIKVDIPIERLGIDDLFDTEAHVTLFTRGKPFRAKFEAVK